MWPSGEDGRFCCKTGFGRNKIQPAGKLLPADIHPHALRALFTAGASFATAGSWLDCADGAVVLEAAFRCGV